MLIIQHNFGRGYENIVIALKTRLSVGAGIVMLQKPFMSNRELCHSAFNFYWPQGNRTEIRVITVVRRDLLDKIVVEHKTDLVNHSYFILFEIRELDWQLKRPGRKTRVINIYDNRVGQGYT